MRLLARAVVAVVLLALGAGTAVAAVAVHEIGAWGLPLAVLATALTLAALPPGWWLRLPFAVGWTGVVGWAATPQTEGGYLISADWRGYTLLGAALVVLVVGIATLPRPGSRRGRTARDDSSEPSGDGPSDATRPRERETAAPEI